MGQREHDDPWVQSDKDQGHAVQTGMSAAWHCAERGPASGGGADHRKGRKRGGSDHLIFMSRYLLKVSIKFQYDY